MTQAFIERTHKQGCIGRWINVNGFDFRETL